jgi:3-hydroxyacyl-[acyl-carrier-protein] dehydratase
MRLEYFQMVDRVVELDVDGRTIKTLARVPHSSPIFEGHFPDHPLMPGVLLIESMAQASGWLIIAVTNFDRMPFLATVREAKLRTFVLPGQALTVSASIVHEGSGFAVTESSIKLDDTKTVASSELTFRLLAFPDPKFRASMAKVAAAIDFPLRTPPHG